MSTWTAPHEGTFHFVKAETPHPFEDCGDWCMGAGWKGRRAKDTVINTDDDPNEDPARFGGGRPTVPALSNGSSSPPTQPN